MPEYSHTLIPEQFDYTPTPSQINSFYSELREIGAAPVDPSVRRGALTGETRHYVNPFNGRPGSHQVVKYITVDGLEAIESAILGLEYYTVRFEGKGPTKAPPLVFDFAGEYDFAVCCHLRPAVVSTSDWHSERPIGREVVTFGKPCGPTERLGIFHHPQTLEIIEVPNAGCARFWIEFEFGKMLFPNVADSLELLNPSILEAAKNSFQVGFVQGCHWCA